MAETIPMTPSQVLKDALSIISGATAIEEVVL